MNKYWLARCCCCLPCTIVAVGHGLFKKFWPFGTRLRSTKPKLGGDRTRGARKTRCAPPPRQNTVNAPALPFLATLTNSYNAVTK